MGAPLMAMERGEVVLAHRLRYTEGEPLASRTAEASLAVYEAIREVDD